MLLHHRPDLLGRERALQLLSTEELPLDSLPGLAALRANEGLGALAVAAAEAGGDEVGHAAALEEGAVLDVRVEMPDEGDHFLEADADERSLGVPSEPESVAEADAQGHDVLERTAELHPGDVAHGADPERGSVEELHEHVRIPLGGLNAERGLAELPLGDLPGDVGAHENRHVVAQRLPENVGAQAQISALQFQASLDQADGHGPRLGRSHLAYRARDELVRDHPDQDVSVRGCLLHVGLCADVGRQLDAREVLDVLLGLVEDLGELALDAPVLHLLLEHPHGDCVLKLVMPRRVLGDDLRDGAAPVSTPDHRDLLWVLDDHG
mmetsp:Transcript_31235/g.97990  ORF Transcript_31235/g.97990 Transcript_31235/m.97990 type:complete len:324 (+) Transcript_31235:227-1198(+)